ncbi:MAG: PstS family phosphate ABC transporter substrate-binding protein [Plesiomonas sp.]
MKLKALVSALSFTLVASFASSTYAAVDSNLADYKKVSGVSGNLSSVGSDTLANLMTLWAEQFKREYANVNIQVQAAGSSTAPPALTEGTAQLGPMSRKMKGKEIEAFEKKFGYQPMGIPVAIDALAVFVNKDNPIKGLNFEQLDAIYSTTLKCGANEPVTRWGQLGVTGELANKDIQLYGRNSVSGTYGYFKDHALCKGDFRSNVNEQPGSASVVQSVGASLNSIGYTGIGYKTSGVRALPLAEKGTAYVEPTEANAIDGTYPLSRYLYIYVNKHPNKPLDPMTAEFLKMVLSKQGQELVEKDGYISVPAKVIAKDLEALGIK